MYDLEGWYVINDTGYGSKNNKIHNKEMNSFNEISDYTVDSICQFFKIDKDSFFYGITPYVCIYTAIMRRGYNFGLSAISFKIGRSEHTCVGYRLMKFDLYMLDSDFRGGVETFIKSYYDSKIYSFVLSEIKVYVNRAPKKSIVPEGLSKIMEDLIDYVCISYSIDRKTEFMTDSRCGTCVKARAMYCAMVRFGLGVKPVNIMKKIDKTNAAIFNYSELLNSQINSNHVWADELRYMCEEKKLSFDKIKKGLNNIKRRKKPLNMNKQNAI